MNLEDVLDSECGLQQDDWSLTAPRFGSEGQLEVVGHNGGKGNKKYYILVCSLCKQDSELFTGGYFRSTKSDLMKASIPCGCSKSTNWSKEQYLTLCTRRAEELGYALLGFYGEWRGAFTRVKMLCEKHGEWDSGSVNTLIHQSCACPGCKVDKLGKASIKPDDVMIASFFASGGFHPDTKFWRSERRNGQSFKTFWFMSCPECGEIGEVASYSLQKGSRDCACNMHRQQECYINCLIDRNANAVAIKFGIARDSKQRIKSQDRHSSYTLKQHAVYTFPTVKQCKQAERECKQALDCGIISKQDMPDGYTETTYVYNLDKIIQIYKKHGGVKL